MELNFSLIFKKDTVYQTKYPTIACLQAVFNKPLAKERKSSNNVAKI